jgi:hypothetical protein
MKCAIQRASSLFCFLSFLLLAPTLWAQYGSSLQGTISDQSGAAVAGATVTATNQATGVSRETQTNDSGFYRISGLPPSTYRVVAQASSFKEGTAPDVVVAAEAVRGLNISLQPGGAQETITVIAAGEALQTENASVTGTLTAQQVTDLPEFGRDPYNLVRLTPGVFADAARSANGNSQGIPQQVGPGGSNSQIFQTENQVQAIADGQRVTANDYTLDGVSVNSLEWGGAAVVTPNEESVQEITVASNTYSAQDGRNSGAQVKVISKNGTNNFHGSALIKFNDKGLNAYNKFEGPTSLPATQLTCESGTSSEFKLIARQCPGRVDQKYRDFAGSIGGPVIKDKLFFFFSYEGVRLSNQALLRSQTLETPQFEQYVIKNNPGGLAAKIFSTPGITPRISTIDGPETDCCSFSPSNVLGQWYVAGNTPGQTPAQGPGNGPDGTPDWGIFDLSEPNRSSGNQYNGRVDYTHGSDQFFVSTYLVRLNNYNGGQRPTDDLTLTPHSYAATIGWSRTLSPTMLNELRANFTRWNFDQRQPVGATDFGIPQIRLFDFDIGGFGANDNFLGITQNSTTPGALAQNTYGLADTLSWVNHQHAWKFGVMAQREQNNNDQSGAQRPQYQFRGLMNFANDACCFYEQVEVSPTGGALNEQRYFRSSDYALFAQDDWKLRPNLTLNLGVRWEYFGPLTEAKGMLSNYVIGSDWVMNGFVCGPAPLANRCRNGNQLYSAQYHDFGPRVGFAWSPSFGHDKLVFRGGFGMIFNRNYDAVFDNIRQDTPFTALASSCCFFDPGPIVGAPPGSNMLYSVGANKQANSYPVNPAYAFGVTPQGALCSSAGCATTARASLFAALPNEPNPYVYIFSYEAQLEPIRDWVFKLGYQGSRSRKLVRTIDLNRYLPGDTFDGNLDYVQNNGSNGQLCGSTNSTCSFQHATGNTLFSNIYTPLPDVNASFDAAVLSVDRKFKRGFQIAGSYTWSHAIDTASYEVGFQQTDPSNQKIDRGDSDFDIRRNLVLSGTWQSPFIGGRDSWMGKAIGGWSISGILSKHTGYPFAALIGSCNTNADRNGDGYCPDLPFNYFGGAISNPNKQQFINGIFPTCKADSTGNVTNATCPDFDITTLGPGCRCRNIFRGPGYTSLDMALGKNFALPRTTALGELAQLSVRANFFNAFNILNLAPFIPATAPTDIKNANSFGHAPDGLAGRVIEFQARLSF